MTHFHEAGQGAPIVLIHGSGPGTTALATWSRVIPAIAARYRVLALDLVGFGLTERRSGQIYDRESWLDHLEGFLDAVGIERASLVGNSLGGALALGLADRRPARVDRLILIASPVLSFPVTKGLEAIWGYQPSREQMRRVLEMLAYDRRLITDEVVDARHQASIASGVYEAFASMFPAPYQRWLDAMSFSEARLRLVRQPTLIVHGRNDRVVPPGTARRLVKILPSAELKIYDKCGHWLTVERANDLSTLILDFLRRPLQPVATHPRSGREPNLPIRKEPNELFHD